MATKVTLKKIEQQAVKLPFQEQLELLSRLSNRLTKIIPYPATESKKKVVKKATSILRECDAAARRSLKTDSAETIRRIRDEACQSVTEQVIDASGIKMGCEESPFQAVKLLRDSCPNQTYIASAI
jgi:hypothetical protein